MDATFLIFYLIVLISSVVIHEVSHGYVAERLGDPTARLAGRLTLNPMVHLDLFGSFLFPLLLIVIGSPILLGWAKPVPYNPMNLTKDMKYGPLKVALAGPLSNLLLLAVFGVLARLGVGTVSTELIALFGFMAFVNAILAVFNLLPIPPLDGSKVLTVLLPPRYAIAVEQMGMLGIFLVLAFLFIFPGVIFGLAQSLFFAAAGGEAASATLQFLFQ